eukprot:SAG22_NODE_519_length_9510_cov_6.192222_5_plen_189_part_00
MACQKLTRQRRRLRSCRGLCSQWGGWPRSVRCSIVHTAATGPSCRTRSRVGAVEESHSQLLGLTLCRTDPLHPFSHRRFPVCVLDHTQLRLGRHARLHALPLRFHGFFVCTFGAGQEHLGRPCPSRCPASWRAQMIELTKFIVPWIGSPRHGSTRHIGGKPLPAGRAGRLAQTPVGPYMVLVSSTSTT